MRTSFNEDEAVTTALLAGVWTYTMKADSSWFCDGNIDKSTGCLERWSCDEMMGRWKCSYDLGRLFPLIMPVTSAGQRN